MFQTLRLIILSISLSSVITACSTIATDVPLVYEIDIDQGNIIDQLMINQLRPNMTKRQVIYILGSPLLIDPFTPNRWDYIYSQQPGHEDRVQQRVALFFNGDNLVHIAGDLAPEINPPPPPPKEITVDAPKRELKKTLYEMIASLFTFED
ncbi:MAG: outer membrane protein assembly factor BamE [Methyloprofundus sp.]|nr:outer membrane protein assembly factor BamE [Methyloprofundus sp.]MDT8424983.1 outer membrane protein assembly factor BamE [Methyloprofundus sp.]